MKDDMTLTLQQLSDRAEIQDVVTAYAAVIDAQEFGRLADVFLPDARFDFRDVGGFEADNLADFVAWLESGLTPMAGRYFHLCAPTRIDVVGDRADVTTLCLNPLPSDNGTLLFGHWYRDEFVRTEDGWRITKRILDVCFTASLPPAMSGPTA